jgi:hypothetical protein
VKITHPKNKIKNAAKETITTLQNKLNTLKEA